MNNIVNVVVLLMWFVKGVSVMVYVEIGECVWKKIKCFVDFEDVVVASSSKIIVIEFE